MKPFRFPTKSALWLLAARALRLLALTRIVRISPTGLALLTLFSQGLSPETARAGAIKYNQVVGDMLWPDGRIPYVFKDDVTADMRKVFMRACRAWQRVGNFRFVPTTQNLVHVSPDGAFVEVQRNNLPYDPNYAWIGRCGYLGYPWTGMQPFSVSDDHWSGPLVLHELGHVIGFIHEQMRIDRDEYIALDWGQINAFTFINFAIENRSWAFSAYDYQSVMHYSNDAFRYEGKTGDSMRAKVPAGTPIAIPGPGPEDILAAKRTRTMGRNWEVDPVTKKSNLPYPGEYSVGDEVIGYLTAGLSYGDRQTVVANYGSPTKISGVVRHHLNNAFTIEDVTVELLPNGGDSVHLINLMKVEGEDEVITSKNGEFTFLGVAAGNYKLRVSKDGYTFVDDEVAITCSANSDLVRNFEVTTTDDQTFPKITIETPPPNVHKHYKGTSGSGADILNAISGKVEDDGPLGVQKVQSALSSNGRWWNKTTGSLDAEGTPHDEALHAWTQDYGPSGSGSGQRVWYVSGAWPSPVPGSTLPEGSYHLQVRALDMNNNWSPWGVKVATFTIDATPPVFTSSPPPLGSPVFYMGIDEIGGPASDGGDPSPEIRFVLKEDNGASPPRFWNGSLWVWDGDDPDVQLPGIIVNGRWQPASESILPDRSQLREGPFTMTASVVDKAGHSVNAAPITFVRSPLDTTLPEVAISQPVHGVIYTEPAMPNITGTASDAESGIKGVLLYLMRLIPNGGGFKYWTGQEWIDDWEGTVQTPYKPHFDVAYNKADGTWTAPGHNFRMPSGAAELPDGTYKIQAYAYNRESPQGSTLVERTFHIAVDPPRVDITSVTHNGWAKAGWTLGGTVTDTAGVGFSDSNRVSLTIFRDGEYWDGDEWGAFQEKLYADILPDGTWTYPGTTPGALMPTGDGSYSVSVHVRDNNGNVNVVVGPGLPGNNQVTFTVDATPPLLEVHSPVPDTEVTGPPLPADWIKGLAFDSSGPVTVVLKLARTPVFEWEMPAHWNGETWQHGETSSYYFGPIELEGQFPGDAGPTSWRYNGPLPSLGWESSFCLSNGTYQIVAVATDLAGNETTVSRPFTVDYRPEYFPPDVDFTLIEPGQTPVWGTGQITTGNAATFNPAAGNPAAIGWQPRHFAVSDSGTIFTTSQLTTTGFNYRAVVNRLGATSWQSERELSSVTDAEGTSYFERWFPGDGFTPIPQWMYQTGHSFPDAMETDGAGNLYVLFRQSQSRHARLVKYSAAGSVEWTRTVPELENDESFIGVPALSQMAWLPDGSLGLLFMPQWTYDQPSFSEFVTAMVVYETDGDLRYEKVIGIHNSYDIEAPGNFENEPIDFAGDSDGNVYVATLETSRGVGYGKWPLPFVRRAIRKLAPNGTVLAHYVAHVGDTPERWDSVATDPDGNLYVGGVFLGEVRSPSDQPRQVVLKFDSNLQLLWRAYGPGRSLTTVDKVMRMDAGPDGVLTYDNSSMAAFYSAAGQLGWSREILQGDISTESVVMKGGDVHALIFDWSQQSGSTYYLAKISRGGDLQMRLQLDSQNYSGFHELQVQGNHLYVLQRPFFGDEATIVRYEVPANSGIPVTLDPDEPDDQVLLAGDLFELTVYNSGSLATGYQWWVRKPGSGWEEIPDATGRTLRIPSVTLADSGQYECEVTNAVDSDVSRTANVTVLEPVSLELSLDTPGRTWTTGGDAPWVGFAGEPSNDGIDAAMNRPIKKGQEAWIETTVTGPAIVSFYWKSSNNYPTDEFEFSIDGNIEAYLSGEHDWTPVSRSVGAGEHTLRWRYYKASNSPSTGDLVWLDEVSISTSTSLEEALDTTGLTWTTSPGALAWSGVTTPSHDGVDSASSGTTGHEQQSYIETTVTGPGTLSFWWKVSSEDGPDVLKLTVDGVSYGYITGEVDWTRVTRPISAGTHIVRWTYEKDFFFTAGLDRAWLDQVSMTIPTTLTLVNGMASANGTILPGERQEFQFLLSGTTRQVGIGTQGGASLRGELYDGSRNLVASAYGDTDFQFNELLPPGLYSLQIFREPGAGSAQNFSLTIDASVLLAPRPDVAVGLSLGGLQGVGAYTTSQKVTINSVKARAVTGYATVANRGTLPDTLVVSASRGSAFFRVTYFNATGANVTAALNSGTLNTLAMDENDAPISIRASIVPNKKKLTKKVGKHSIIQKKTFNILVRATSTANPTISDSATISVKTK